MKTPPEGLAKDPAGRPRGERKPAVPSDLAPADFFVFRSPLLPLATLDEWGTGLKAPGAAAADLEAALSSDRATLRERLRALVARPEIREALLVASPVLDESLPSWLAAPDSERGLKVEQTLVRYLARMAFRATPFGLFAGCSLGRTDPDGPDGTRLVIEQRASYGRHTRLDMDYLFSLTEALAKLPDLRAALRFRPNSSLYRAAGRLRYAEARLDGKLRTYHLVAVDPSDYLEATLARAAGGARPGDLAAALCEGDAEIAREEADGFIGELIDSQILQPELTPAVTGPEPIHELCDALRVLESAPDARLAADRLSAVRDELASLDAGGPGAGAEPYQRVAALLADLPVKVELPRLFQVDMTKPAPAARLGGAVLDEITRTLGVLRRISGGSGEDALSRFRDAFRARYEGREVPLCEALDEESGIGFGEGGEAAEASPLLEGLAFPGGPPGPDRFTARHAFLLRRLGRDPGAPELRLGEDDLAALENPSPPSLPDSFSVMCTLARAGADDFRVLFHGASGPSGANLLGRFCHGFPELEDAVRRYLALEEARSPDAVFAEVVHLPEGRVGNVLLRPLLRRYEIPFLGRSGAAEGDRIGITDLTVAVRGDRVVLRSLRLDREVIPRLTSAHNFVYRSLGLYRFLCTLQSQGVGSLGWSWGPLESLAYLPRVVVGRTVLARARWRLDGQEWKPAIEGKGATRFAAATLLRERLGLPRRIAIVDGDNVLPIDLDNVLSVDQLAHVMRGRDGLAAIESYPGPGELLLDGPEGQFSHELLIPFTRRAAASESANASRSARPEASASDAGFARSFPPGSEWLYAKLYAGTATVDQVLRELGPIVAGLASSRAVDAWFFIRYGDPDWHLRLRLHGEPARLAAEALPALHAAVAPLIADGKVNKLQLDTYDREVERYGGPEGMLLCERIFQADSECALAIVETLSGDAGADARWRLALAGCDRLLDALGLDEARKRALMRATREAFGREFRIHEGAGSGLEKQLGDRFRKERGALERLLDPAVAADPEHPLAPGLAALATRDRAIAEPAAGLRALEASGRLRESLPSLGGSLIHMHANRLLRAAARQQELVIYDLLDRIYQGREARSRRAPKP